MNLHPTNSSISRKFFSSDKHLKEEQCEREWFYLTKEKEKYLSSQTRKQVQQDMGGKHYSWRELQDPKEGVRLNVQKGHKEGQSS